MVRGIAKKDTRSRPGLEFMRGGGDSIRVTQTPKDSKVGKSGVCVVEKTSGRPVFDDGGGKNI